MLEAFHGVVGCRDVFDTLSSVTIDWLVANDAEEIYHSRLEFDKQVENVLQQLQIPHGVMFTHENSANDISSMLCTDNFAFREMLSYAAHWPDIQEINDISFGIITRTATGSNPYTLY